MEGRKCSLVKIAHCMNLKTDIWKPEERVRDGTTDGSSAAETLTILSNAERLPWVDPGSIAEHRPAHRAGEESL